MEFSLFLPLLPPSLFIMLGSKKISGRTVHLVLHAAMESMWRLAPRLFESEKKSHTAPVKKQPGRDSPQKCDNGLRRAILVETLNLVARPLGLLDRL